MNIFGDSKELRILKLFSRGAPSAMDELYAYASDRLTGVCSRYVSNEEDVRDVLQECFIKIFTEIGRFHYRGKGSLMAWMTRIAMNESLQWLRKRRQLSFVDADSDLPDVVDEQPEISRLTQDDILDALRQLPPGYRTVFNLFVVEGKKHQEIAEMLNIRPDTSASQLHRAKILLAKILKEKEKLKSK